MEKAPVYIPLSFFSFARNLGRRREAVDRKYNLMLVCLEWSNDPTPLYKFINLIVRVFIYKVGPTY